MKRPIESDYTSLAAYTRALEEYCDTLSRVEQQPLGYIASMAANDLLASIYRDVTVYGEDLEDTVAIYTTPPAAQRKPLTDDEMKLLWAKHGYKSAMCKPFARAIEAAHGIGEKA